MLIFIHLHRYGEVYERRALPFLLNVKRGAAWVFGALIAARFIGCVLDDLPRLAIEVLADGVQGA